MKVVIDSEVMSVLREGRLDGQAFYLPARQLERKLYERVNKALALAGGKWNTSKKAHVFVKDPQIKLGDAIATGTIVNDKKRLQAFYTPKALAQFVAMEASVEGHVVLEPSAGEGALADACRISEAKQVRCFEIDPDACRILENKGYQVLCTDFLKQRPLAIYTRVVMNPPFANDQDIAHVEHALQWVMRKFILVALMGGNQSRTKFQDLIARLRSQGREYQITPIPAGAFKESGTMIETIMLRITNRP